MQRYWDGQAWTEHTAPGPAGVAPAVATAPTAYGNPAAFNGAPTKKKLSTGAIVAIVVGGVAVLGIIVVGILAAVAGPVLNEQQAKAYDSAARADVSTLGLEIAVYFVDHDGPPPTITIVDGAFAFADGTPLFETARASQGVELGGQSGTGATDWCVWVSAPDGDLKDFEYSAQNGLLPGRCGQ
jgi:type II secretory pathway pseudopilin PulG